MIKNALAILLMSHGVPMILMGDEVGRTQRGNNNTYCHDNDLNWFDWSLLERNADLFHFARQMIAFRKTHPLLRAREHLGMSTAQADFIWHGVHAWNADWSPGSRTLAFMLRERQAGQGEYQPGALHGPERLLGRLAFPFTRIADQLSLASVRQHGAIVAPRHL